MLFRSLWELLAVILAIAYLVLAVRENIACWYAAFVSTAIFLVIFWQVNLYMESALQVYYLGMAVYGWYAWQHADTEDQALAISTWRLQTHVLVITGVLLLAVVSGYLLGEHTDARLPYLDSFTTWGAVVTTFMVARDSWLVDFVKDLTEVNKGRAYYSSLNQLGEYIFVEIGRAHV